MKTSILLLLAFIFYFAGIANAQAYIDPDLNVEARVFSYKLSSAPVIDGIDNEWADIPWQILHYNDKDFNGDNLSDPFPGRLDYQSKFKSAWVDGSNILYLLINIKDDRFYTADSVNWYNVDGMEIRVDPYDEEAAGEPGDNPSSAFNLGFKVGQDASSGVEGAAPSSYEAKWVIDENTFPKQAQLEVAITLPDGLNLQEAYNMGFYLYCSDNDLGQDDSPTSKDAATDLWPQMYSAVDGGTKVGVDQVWSNIYYWGNLECITLNQKEVKAGESIQAAIDAASEGDIINVAAGTFTENLVIDKPYIQLIGTMTDTDTTKIVPADGGQPALKVADDDAAYGVVVKNLYFYGWTTGANSEVVHGDRGIEFGSAQLQVLGNHLTGFEFPIRKSSVGDTKAYACIFEDNYINECNAGILCNTPGTVMRYNVIEENTGGYGIEAKGLLEENTIDIAYNTVFNHHGECGVGYGGSGIFTIHNNMLIRSEQLYGANDQTGDDGIENQDAGGSTDYIYNNTIVGWKSDGMQLGGSSDGTSDYYIRNNLVANCGANDYDIRTTSSYDIDYGLSYSNKGSNLVTTLGSNSIEADPQFTAEFEDDFTIMETSPAVDKGETEPSGFKLMYFDDGLDIGAFETGSVVVSVEDEVNNAPVKYSLGQNYPNPFNPSTTIRFSLPQNDKITIKLYNVIGQFISTLVNGNMSAGEHQISFNGAGLTSGVYFYTLQGNDYSVTKKMILLK